MPREARQKKLYSNYYITQCGPKTDVIFSSEEDRKIFIRTLENVKTKYNFKLYGVGISPNGYEILLYDNGNDISKIMKSINISFAMKYKCEHEDCDSVFKERYKSVIVGQNELASVLSKMPLCIYIDAGLLDSTDEKEFNYNQVCLDCIEKAKSKLEEIVVTEGHTFEEMLKNKKWRNTLIQDFRKNSILSLSEIGDLFGGLSESAICKILNKC